MYIFPCKRTRYIKPIAINTHIDYLNNSKCSVRYIFKATKQGALKVTLHHSLLLIISPHNCSITCVNQTAMQQKQVSEEQDLSFKAKIPCSTYQETFPKLGMRSSHSYKKNQLSPMANANGTVVDSYLKKNYDRNCQFSPDPTTS